MSPGRILYTFPSFFNWVCLIMLCTPKNPMVLLIIIPTKNGYNWWYTPFPDIPNCKRPVRQLAIVFVAKPIAIFGGWFFLDGGPPKFWRFNLWLKRKMMANHEMSEKNHCRVAKIASFGNHTLGSPLELDG